MIMGGSFVSTGDEAGPYARFHFRPHFFQHAGFRIARSAQDPQPRRIGKASPYETREMLNRYLLMHWGSDADIAAGAPEGIALPQVVNLPLACAQLVTRFASGRARALDLGCAVGRAAFELARDFAEVLGIDYSHEFIDAADALRRDGVCGYARKEQGDLEIPLTARVDPAIDRARLRFEQGDACALPPDLQAFDAVLLANVLCRLPDPAACLARMQELVAPGGVLVMTTPFSWLEQYTPRERWLNGVADVARHLPGFALVHEEELPFLIREHRRKYEYIVTKATVWRRRS
jgi:putative 4-mercaptohistidine N1-methyltranferase